MARPAQLAGERFRGFPAGASGYDQLCGSADQLPNGRPRLGVLRAGYFSGHAEADSELRAALCVSDSLDRARRPRDISRPQEQQAGYSAGFEHADAAAAGYTVAALGLSIRDDAAGGLAEVIPEARQK